MWLASDVLLKELAVDVGELVVGELLGIVGNLDEFAVIVSSLGSCHASVIDDAVEFLRHLLRTDEGGSVASEELGEVVYAVPFRQLVADTSNDHFLEFRPHLYASSERFLHRNALASILFSEVEEDAVGHLVVERVVDL